MSQDYTQKIKDIMANKLEELQALVEIHMEESGLKSEDSQKVAMGLALKNVDAHINGIESEDLKVPTKELNFLNMGAYDNYLDGGEDAALFAVTIVIKEPDGLLSILMDADNKQEAGEKALEYAKNRLGMGHRPMTLGLVDVLTQKDIDELGWSQ